MSNSHQSGRGLSAVFVIRHSLFEIRHCHWWEMRVGMRLVIYDLQGRTRLGAEQDGHVVDLNLGYALLLATRGVADFSAQANRELPPDMRDFLDVWDRSLPR